MSPRMDINSMLNAGDGVADHRRQDTASGVRQSHSSSSSCPIPQTTFNIASPPLDSRTSRNAHPFLVRTVSDSSSESVYSPLTPSSSVLDLSYTRDPARLNYFSACAADPTISKALQSRPVLHSFYSRSTHSHSPGVAMDYPTEAGHLYSKPVSEYPSAHYPTILPSPQALHNQVQQQQHHLQQPHSNNTTIPSLPLMPQSSFLGLPQCADPLPRPSSRKNSYPCPVSRLYACPEHFTTSGHAARHAKKHTGKKDAICPECHKGFTRKDNMEQHRRTHAPGRANSKATPNDDFKQQQRTKLKLNHQNATSSQKFRPAHSISSLAVPDPAHQTMSADLISPQPQPSNIATATNVECLDPALQSPPAQTSYGQTISLSPWPQSNPVAHYMATPQYGLALELSPNTRPKLQRSVGGDSHREVPPRSHSASSGAGSTDSNGLELLATAADRASSRV